MDQSLSSVPKTMPNSIPTQLSSESQLRAVQPRNLAEHLELNTILNYRRKTYRKSKRGRDGQ